MQGTWWFSQLQFIFLSSAFPAHFRVPYWIPLCTNADSCLLTFVQLKFSLLNFPSIEWNESMTFCDFKVFSSFVSGHGSIGQHFIGQGRDVCLGFCRVDVHGSCSWKKQGLPSLLCWLWPLKVTCCIHCKLGKPYLASQSHDKKEKVWRAIKFSKNGYRQQLQQCNTEDSKQLWCIWSAT